ncbi:hypothetical protein CU254_00475 [Amycolatopsis sp. AA4]|uniref:hypothetical protein n=1 Tax=Actinomycetes TaxID=1760 RepID=UPI0001B55A20|nr:MULTISPECIES: hypothetical protein [Actinomycetes]ATY09127.1 hypothetical protein CU254_00475 [Amycolatopsis sp. AA4]
MRGLDTNAAGVVTLGKAVSQAAEAIAAVRATICDADELARKYGSRRRLSDPAANRHGGTAAQTAQTEAKRGTLAWTRHR